MTPETRDLRLQALLELYAQDREEERLQRNRLHAMFVTFMLIILGGTNVFIQLSSVTVTTWLIFTVSILGASFLYRHMHEDAQKRLHDAAQIKEGREILIKVLLGEGFIGDYAEDLISAEAADTLENRLSSKNYPFLAFDDIVKIKLHYREDAKKRVVTVTSVAVSVLALLHLLATSGTLASLW